jgi:hypothetical protein
MEMKKMRKTLAILMLTAGIAGAHAQSSTGDGSKTAHTKHKTQQQILAEQDARIEKLEQEVHEMHELMMARDKELTEAKDKAALAQAEIEMAAKQEKLRSESTLEKVAKDTADIDGLEKSVAVLTSTNEALETSLLNSQKANADRTNAALENPASIRFLGVDLKPGGFLAGETVNRQRALGADVNTPFNALPFSGQTAADFSEFNGSGRQSRISLMTEGKLSNATLRGYYEADFLSAAATSNDNESNSYSLRQRQVWAQAALNSGWTFTGGQMWSLATEYRSGLTNTKEAIPQTIDAQYNVGFTWERQYGFRVAKKIGTELTAGVSVEEAQTLNIGGHNLPAIVYQQPGNASGLYNPGANYSYNYAPDLIGKVAYDPSFGHFELFAIGRFFRARVFPNDLSLNGGTASTTPTEGAYTAKTQGGGFGLNARVPVFSKKLELAGHLLAGDGIGRYSTSSLADATERPDGSLELLTGGSALFSAEYHPTSKLDLYGYYGGEYAKRAYYSTGLTVLSGINVGLPVLTGYGAPTNNNSGCHVEVAPVTSSNGGGYAPGTAVNCSADNRNIQEGTFGYWYRFYKGPKGMLQQGFQYSYAVRHTWLGIGDPLSGLGGSPKAIDNMWFASFRYYLPQ